MIQTQLVRLDKPYNIIFSKDGSFGLHIATLIVVKEKPMKDEETGSVIDTYPVVDSYPIVGGGTGIDGETWVKSEIKDCMVICREGMCIGLYTLKELMEFCSKTYHFYEFLFGIPTMLSVALMTYGSKFKLPTDENKRTINDYDVRLEFTESNGGQSCLVYAAKESDFYFYDFFDTEPPFSQFAHTNSEAINFLAELRDSYLSAFHFEGLHSITFTTEDSKYQWFVDKLNNTKVDAGGGE